MPPKEGDVQLSGSETDFRDKYIIGDMLGQGAFGTVYDCTSIETKIVYAVKVLEDDQSAEESMWSEFFKELHMLQSLDHANINKLHEVFVDDYFCYVVLDKFAADLMDAALALQDKGKNMSQGMLVRIFAQKMMGVQYLHNKRIVHRDIKAENSLVDTPDFSKKDFTLVLSDFGTAVVLKPKEVCTVQAGTKLYWAPEMILKNYRFGVDVWAVGVTIYGITSWSFPFDTPQDVLSQKLQLSSGLPEGLRSLLTGLLRKDPKKRLTPEQSLSHPWVKAVLGQIQPKPAAPKEEPKKDAKKAAPEAAKEAPKAAAPAPAAPPAEVEDALTIPKKSGDGSNFVKQRKEVPEEVKERRRRHLAEIEADYKKGIRRGKKVQARNIQRRHTIEVLPTSVFLTEDANGGVHTWEWWSKPRCIDAGIGDVEAPEGADSTTQTGAKAQGQPLLTNLASVVFPWTADGLAQFMADHDVDTATFGVGAAKSLTQFSQELLRGESALMESSDDDGNTKLVRVLDIVVVRLHSGDKRLLIETKQTFDDGRTRARNLLPGMLRRPHEDSGATAKRVLLEEIGLPSSCFDIDVCEDEELNEEQVSPSYPGLKSVYQKHFIDCFIETEDPAILAKIGLPGGTDFETKQPKLTLGFSWFSLEQCAKSGLAVQGKKKSYVSEDSNPFQRAEGNWTEKVLVDLLKSKKIPIESYGQGEAKSIKQFLEELQAGNAYIMQSQDKVLRMVDLVTVRVHGQDGSLLVETSEKFQDGRERERNCLPGRKRKPNEDSKQTARRILYEVNLDPDQISVVLGNEVWDEKESPTYPHIKTVYRKHIMDAFMPADDSGVLQKGNMMGDTTKLLNKRKSCFM